MYEARQNINVYPRTISTVRNRYNRPPQAIQRHVFLNGKVIGIDRAQKEFERMKLELNIKQITFLKHLIESDKHYLFSELIGLLGIDNRKWKSAGPSKPIREDDSPPLMYYGELHTMFTLPKDAAVIEQYTKEKRCAISIRETGRESLSRLAQGAGTKPHSILDKSLKPKTAPLIADKMNIGYKNRREALKKVLKELDLPKEMSGMVPHWSNGTIDGFYLTQEGVESYKKVPQKKIIQAEGTYLSLASCKNIGKDTKNEKKPSWHRNFITGDYDVHDIVKFRKLNRRNQKRIEIGYPRVPKASDMDSGERHGDTGMLMDINDKMGYSNDQKRFQHGAQVNFKDFAEKHGEPIIEALLHPDFPIALCDRGNWFKISNERQLRRWYIWAKLGYKWKKI